MSRLFLLNSQFGNKNKVKLSPARKYRIIIEDETSLEKKVNVSAGIQIFIFIGLGVLIIAVMLCILILTTTPLKSYLPGYLKESERTATEEQHLRLDSLIKVYEVNETYISNILNVLDPKVEEIEHEKPTDSIITLPLSVDSLLPLSDEERTFVEQIRERDKFNISVLSQLDAETLMFGNIAKSAIISNDSENELKAEFIVPDDTPVSAVAEGKVISIASSPKALGGYEVIIQHPKGFLSKTSRLGRLMVSPGEHVAAGEIIGRLNSNSGRISNIVIFELWHDGNPLVPSKYLNTGQYRQNNINEP